MMLRKQTLPPVKRFLHLFPQPRAEVVIGNNSGIFFTLASLKMHGHRSHPKLQLVMPHFWLDNAHDDYNTLNWGQTPRGLPWYVRQEFLEIFPGHKESDLIQWGQFKQLRSHVIEELKKNGVKVYSGLPNITKTTSEYIISLNANSFSTPLDTYFYNTFKTPNLTHNLLGVANASSHTMLYTLALKNVPNSIILIGSGRSVIWAAQHFSSSIVSCIKYSNKPLPFFKNESRPDNLIEYPIEKFIPTGNEFEIQTMTNQNGINNPSNLETILETIILDLKNPGQDFIGSTYCAIGLQPNLNITKCIDKENLLLYPYEKLSWFGAEETPLGSLMEATQRWASATNNLSWAYETYCYHEDHFIEIFTEKMANAGVILPYTFFDLLRENTLALIEKDSMLNKIPLRVPNNDQVIQLYKDCYMQAFDNNVSAGALKTLENELRKIEQERLQQYQNMPNTSKLILKP